MKKRVVLAVAIILLVLIVIGCGGPSAPTPPTAVPMTPVLVTETPPLPTMVPTVTSSPTVTPPSVACEPVVLTKVTDDTAKFKKIVELGDPRALPSGERVFAVLLSGSTVLIVQTSTPKPAVLVSGVFQNSITFVEGQIYSVRLTCISEGSKAKIEEVRFYYQGNEPYLYFP